MALVDVVLPNGNKYAGAEVPKGCTALELKTLLEGGKLCDKVLYARRLILYADENRQEVLQDSSELPPLLAVGGPPNILQMLDMALKKWLGGPVKPPPPIDATPKQTKSLSSPSRAGPRRVLVLRHGSRPDDGADPLLDDLGEIQAGKVGQFFGQQIKNQPGFAPITAIFSSPFSRALQTVGPVAKAMGLPIRMEFGFSELLAHKWLQMEDPFPALKARSKERLQELVGKAKIDEKYKTAVVPTYPDVVGRLQPGQTKRRLKATKRHAAAVKAALEAADGGSVLIVAHGSTHDFVTASLCPVAWENFECVHTPYCVPNCGITEIVEDPETGWRLVSFGERHWSDEDQYLVPPEKVPVLTGALPDDLRRFLLTSLPTDMTSAVNDWGFERCTDHPQLPKHQYLEGYFHGLAGQSQGSVHSAHPREPFRDRLPRRPAPLQVLAFCEAFRRRNAQGFQEILSLLGASLPPIEKSFRRSGHFADISLQLNWGTAVPQEYAAWHRDAPYSLLHLAVGLQGERTLWARRSLRALAPEAPEALLQKEGAVYLSSPCCFEHAVQYPEAIETQPIVSMQCRFLLLPEELFAMTQMFRACHQVVFEILLFLENYSLQLPTLDEVKGALGEITRSQVSRPLLAEGDLPKYACKAMRLRDLRLYDADWVRPNNRAEAVQAKRVKDARPGLGWPFLEDTDEDTLVGLFGPGSSDFSWSLDYRPHHAAELAYQGVILKSAEMHFAGMRSPVQALVLFCPKRRCMLDPKSVHITRQVRRRAKCYSMTADAAFDDVLLGCVREHGESWLFRGLRWLLRSMRGRTWPCSGSGPGVSLRSFELWDADGQLAAGELGFAVGGVFKSISGFRRQHASSAGTVQMVLMTAALLKLGFTWVDLGEVEPYKASLGARTVSQAEYLKMLRLSRDRHVPFSHKKAEGADLLYQLQEAISAK